MYEKFQEKKTKKYLRNAIYKVFRKKFQPLTHLSCRHVAALIIRKRWSVHIFLLRFCMGYSLENLTKFVHFFGVACCYAVAKQNYSF